MSRRLSRLIVLLAAFQILGGQWLALQSVAWVGMIAKYAQSERLAVAIEKTFDGQHPCRLCQVVNTGRSEEQRHQVVETTFKYDAILTSSIEAPLPAISNVVYVVGSAAGVPRSVAPPTPPPRVA